MSYIIPFMVTPIKMITRENVCCTTDDPDLPVLNFESTINCKITL